MRLSLWTVLSLVILTGLSGCGKLNYNRSETLDSGDVKTYTIDGPSAEQTIRIVVKSTEAEVSVAVIPTKEMPTPFNIDGLEKVKAYATKANAKDIELETKIPAKVDFTVLVYGAKKSTPITVSIQGK